MAYVESNAHVIVDDRWPWNINVVPPICSIPIVSETAGDTDSVTMKHLCSVSQKYPPTVFWQFFPNSWEFLVQILHTYYTFLSTLDCKFLSNYLQFWRNYHNYAILSATTQFTPYVQNIHHRPKRTLAFSDIFPKQLGICGPNFTHLLHVPIYARLQIFIELSSAIMKLCHIKCDHPACVSVDGGHFEHIMVVALNMA